MLTGQLADRDAWRRAFHRAEAQHVQVKVIGSEVMPSGAERTYYKARSVSRPDSVQHGIAIECSSRGVDARCSCEGNQKGYICMHLAAALRHAGLLPDCELAPLPANVIPFPATQNGEPKPAA